MATCETSQQTATEAEISTIKASYPNGCRVVKDVGSFSHVITVQPANMDATIKFQLTAAYPTDKPVVAIRSGSLSAETLADITERVTVTSQSLPPNPMLQALIDETTTQLTAAGLRPGKTLKANQETDLCAAVKKKKKSKRSKRAKEDDDEGDTKLPPMKTALDVVNRIIWDDNLEKDDFLVGYIDRFRGLMEKSFSAFSWEDLACVDYDVLAVPKHRIQYFKYKDVKVWDKTRRVDNVFGSAKGTKTIDVVIKEVEEENVIGRQTNSSAGVARHTESEDSYTDSDDDDDDGIVVTIGAGAGIGNSQPADKTENGENTTDGGYNPYWRDVLRPNYFICVRLTETSLMEQAASVQDHILEREPILAECCIPGASMHVTLCCLGLDTAEQLQSCIDALLKVKTELQSARPTSPIHLRGVDNFYGRVVYAKVQQNPSFLSFVDLLKTLLREAGVQIRDGYEFVPHATLLKVSRPVTRSRGTKNIDPSYYSDYSDTVFGSQNVDSIHLCSMETGRRGDGFYITPLEINFDA